MPDPGEVDPCQAYYHDFWPRPSYPRSNPVICPMTVVSSVAISEYSSMPGIFRQKNGYRDADWFRRDNEMRRYASNEISRMEFARCKKGIVLSRR